MDEQNNAVVALAMSGGVDSSVACLMLKKQYTHVVGATHLIWPDSKCCSPPVIQRAEELCKKMGIPYYVIDMIAKFSEQVVNDFADSYLTGRTPNPCIRCNERIRFTRFYRQLKEQLREDGLLGADQRLLFATGHYASIVEKDGRRYIRKGKDDRKDQSYMLYRVPSEMLANIIFPLGDYSKKDIVKLAREEKLPSGDLKESQDVCFVDDEYVSFLEEYLERKPLADPGDIVDMEGAVLGKHKGFIHYTIGQRKGLNLGNGPWYVAGLDPDRNRVVVGRKDEITSRLFDVEQCNWFSPDLNEDQQLMVKIRYNSPALACRIASREDRFRVVLEEPAVITPGQSAVFYRDDLVLGGGIICSIS